jgi:hypothetical protein
MKRVISAVFCLLVIFSATALVFAKGATTKIRIWALNRTIPRRSGARRRDGRPIEAVRTAPARGIGMCIDTVIAAWTDLR